MTSGRIKTHGGKILLANGKVATRDHCCCNACFANLYVQVGGGVGSNAGINPETGEVVCTNSLAGSRAHYIATDDDHFYTTINKTVYKYDMLLNLVWSTALATSSVSVYSTVLGSDGYLYIIGWRYDTGTTAWKIDPADGGIIWTFDDCPRWATGAKTDSDGNVFVTTHRWPVDCPYNLYKLNSDGEFQWGCDGLADWWNGVALDDSGNIYTTGDYSTGGLTGNCHKVNSSGVIQWSFARDGSQGYDVVVDSSGNPYFCGTNDDDEDCIIKCDPDGNKEWGYEIPDAYFGAGAFSMVIDDEDNVYAVAMRDAMEDEDHVWYVGAVKLDTDGNEEWLTFPIWGPASGWSCTGTSMRPSLSGV